MLENKTVFIFDVDGVLNTYAPKAYREYLFSRSKVSYSKELLPLYISHMRSLVIGKTDMKAFEEALHRDFGIMPQDVKWLRYYIDNAKPRQDVLGILSALRARGHFIALMTNEDALRFDVIKKAFGSYADMMFASSDMKLAKPQAGAYAYVVDAIGRKLKRAINYYDIVFVDDDQGNVDAARRLGMRGIRFAGAQELRDELLEMEAARTPARQQPAQEAERRAEEGRPRFLVDLIASYYKRAADLAPPRIGEREFGVGTLERKIMFRHLNFRSEHELRNYTVENAPQYISYSAAYYRFPAARPMENKAWQGAELVFDLDVTDMHLPCQAVHGKSWICDICLDAVKAETTKLIEDFLVPDFGFSEREMMINFSGNRGYHVHVYSERVSTLDAQARREITGYIAGTGIDLGEFFPTSGMRGKVLRGPKTTDGGWGGKLARSFAKRLGDGAEALVGMGIDRPTANKLYRSKALVEMGINAGNWDMVYIKNKSEFWKAILARQAVSQSDMIDRNVTNDPSHLIRLPNSLHGETGLIAKRVGGVRELDGFDPMKDAVAFRGGDLRVDARTSRALEMNNRTFGPYGGKVTLPTYAAMYLYLKGFATIIDKG